jgi:hypothetical protein
MIIFDLIHDEAPLFSEGIKILLKKDLLLRKNVLSVVDGNRWYEETKDLNTLNRLEYFDILDKQNIDLNLEIRRISLEYDNFNIFACDRYLIQRSRDFQKKILVYTYLFFEYIFAKKVTHYFTTGIAYSYNLISYQVAEKYNVKHISFYGIRVDNRTAISCDVKNTFDEVVKMYDSFTPELVTSEMLEVISRFMTKPKQPDYMVNAINGSSINYVFVREFFIRFKKYYLCKRHKYDLFTRNPFRLSFFKLKKTFRAKMIDFNEKHIFDRVDYNDRYLVFPLHMQPEASTLIASPFDVNQKNTIINISKILPIDTLLYVKEHKSALGQHSKSFYNELKSYPNIKLISYKENMFELIKHSRGTLCLSSTVGLESLQMIKPTVVFGNVFYNSSKLTFRVSSFFELNKVFNLILSQDFNLETHFKNYKKRLSFFLFCLKNKSYNFEFNVAKLDTKKRVMRKENIINFSDFLRHFLKL